MENKKIILVINPGSTSTKIGLFNGEELWFDHNFHHSNKELSQFENVADQIGFRKDLIVAFLKDKNIETKDLSIVMARGGLLKPLASGTYQVNTKMLSDLENATKQHASNLAAMIAHQLTQDLEANAYIADPVVVDELMDEARFSGHPDFPIVSIFHALNQKSIARTYAKSVDEKYENLNLIVAHLGGGISVGAHQKGKVVDVNQAYDGSGPFSPERSGNLPMGDVIKAAYSGKYTEKELQAAIVGKGGVSAYLGTNNMIEVENRVADGDKQATAVLNAMSYQIAKEIGAMAVAMAGKVDAILLTGGVAYCPFICDYIAEKTNFIAPQFVFPGEDELKALALNGLGVLNQTLTAKEYK